MTATRFYGFLADPLLIVHVLFGLLLTILGGILRWHWVRNLWFRLSHLLAIGVVVGEAWADTVCPLTAWESRLRAAAGGFTYSGSFIEYWLHRLIFFDAPQWTFTCAYTAFGVAVLLTWIFVRPTLGRSAVFRKKGDEE